MMYDVAVIGGGPAGNAAAALLARSGMDVVLLERRRYPRHKVCGEFLSHESRRVFATAGVLEQLIARGARGVAAMRITNESGAEVRHQLDKPGLALSRFALDELLAAHSAACGVDVRTQWTARRVEGSLDGGFTIGGSSGMVRARIVIGAFGRGSVLDRTLARPDARRRTPFLGFKRYFRGGSLGDEIELHAARGGYCGLVRVEDGAINACWLIHRSILDEAGSPEATLDLLMNRNPHLRARLENAEPVYDQVLAVSNLGFERRPAVVRGVLMTGDAAGMIAPLCGDGMAMALESAEIAARMARRFIACEIGASELRSEYVQAHEARFTTRMRLGSLLQRGYLAHPRISSVGLAAMRRSHRLTDWIVRSSRG